MSIRVLCCTKKDIDLLLPLVAAYHQFESLTTSPKDREFAIKQLLADHLLGSIWLIFNEDELAGYIVLCYGYSIEFGGRDAFIDEFYLIENQRGKGIGKQVIKLMHDQALKIGIKALHLEVANDNQIAREFYSNLGFELRNKYSLMSLSIDSPG